MQMTIPSEQSMARRLETLGSAILARAAAKMLLERDEPIEISIDPGFTIQLKPERIQELKPERVQEE